MSVSKVRNCRYSFQFDYYLFSVYNNFSCKYFLETAPTMSVVEQPCYTLINLPTDSEPYNEMQLKMDLGK